MPTFSRTASMASNPGLQPSALSHAAASHDTPPSNQNASRSTSAMAGEMGDESERISRPQSRAESTAAASLSRKNTLQKRMSLSRRSSTKRAGLSRAGSVRSLSRQYQAGGDVQDEKMYDPLVSPVPTKSNPTAILADRFQAWRKLLKELVLYFREVASSYETKARLSAKLSSTLPRPSIPSPFLTTGGLLDAVSVLDHFHRDSTAEANRAKLIQSEVIDTLTGLRHDLTAKIKEIKGLSSDFKNSVDKEMEHTRKALAQLQDALDALDSKGAAASGRGDPFMVKLALEKQLASQLDEENYLHRAYLNLENSGRELESIVVAEIQKSFGNYAKIMSTEADQQYETVEKMTAGPLAMDKDYEWISFVERDQNLIDPKRPVRSADDIQYAGKDHPSAMEVKSGMLERKSKYLKSYTPGWYVLSPSYLHEFKSPDRLHDQQPVMSLYLPEQRLGSHSQALSSSHKFILKGRQTGAIHRGHSWTFRAESHDTMLAWYEDIKKLTEVTSGEERDAFVGSRNRHRRASSGASLGMTRAEKTRSIASSAGSINDEDEADQIPYSGAPSVSIDRSYAGARGPGTKPGPGMVSRVDGPDDEDGTLSPPTADPDGSHPHPRSPYSAYGNPTRPSPGGRFPSDLQVQRARNLTMSSSGESTNVSQPGGSGGTEGHTPPDHNHTLAPASTAATTVSGSGMTRDNVHMDESATTTTPSATTGATATTTEKEAVPDVRSVSALQGAPGAAQREAAVGAGAQMVFAPQPVRPPHSLAQV